MTIFEVTVPFETRLQQSRQLKQNKYRVSHNPRYTFLGSILAMK